MELTREVVEEALEAARYHRSDKSYIAFKEKYKHTPGTVLRFAARHLLSLWEHEGRSKLDKAEDWDPSPECIRGALDAIEKKESINCIQLAHLATGAKRYLDSLPKGGDNEV